MQIDLAFSTRITRREALAGGAAGTVALMSERAEAQQAAPAAVPEKGPRVWLDLDQRELDDAYDQMKYDPNLPQTVKRCAINSELVRARLGAPKRFAYGTTPIEGLDVYATRRPNAPVNVFVHGGAWQRYAAKDYAFPAELFVNAGAHFASLSEIGTKRSN